MATIERLDAAVREEWDTTARIYRRWVDGSLVDERPFTEAETASVDAQARDDARAANRASLMGRVRLALATNAAYLDKVQAGTAVNADHVAQTAALTRQTQAIIRLLAGADLLDQAT
ncbi:hypothetical protein [Streptomyces sp. NPDC059828]|uniref:hypothetical protein n=1 Tax=Streptomyces sp. NPDC059828 TaxID=3346965 RepID=UPI00365275C0